MSGVFADRRGGFTSALIFAEVLPSIGSCEGWRAAWELLQRESAERAAADAPGITQVENRIVVEPRSFDAVPDEMC